METWKTLDVKTKIAYVTAIIAFTLGWGLSVSGFIIGAGVISDSVLWVLGQALVYTASVFGIGMYTTGEVKKMKMSVRNFINEEKRVLEPEAEEVTEEPENE